MKVANWISVVIAHNNSSIVHHVLHLFEPHSIFVVDSINMDDEIMETDASYNCIRSRGTTATHQPPTENLKLGGEQTESSFNPDAYLGQVEVERGVFWCVPLGALEGSK